MIKVTKKLKDGSEAQLLADESQIEQLRKDSRFEVSEQTEEKPRRGRPARNAEEAE